MKNQSFKVRFETVNPLQEGMSQVGLWRSITFTVRLIDEDGDDGQTMVLRARGRVALCINYMMQDGQLHGVFRVTVRFGTHTYWGSDNQQHTINDIVCLHFDKEDEEAWQ